MYNNNKNNNNKNNNNNSSSNNNNKKNNNNNNNKAPLLPGANLRRCRPRTNMKGAYLYLTEKQPQADVSQNGI